MAIDYRTLPAPTGRELAILNHEEKGLSFASFDGKCIVTGGHNRPLIMENTGDGISTRWMGIKPPLIGPDVTVGSGGAYSGSCQVAFCRMNSRTGERSDVSPIWPLSDLVSAQASDSEYTWESVSTKKVVNLGSVNGSTVTAFAQKIDFQSTLQSRFVFGASDSSDTVDVSKVHIGGVSIIGYRTRLQGGDAGDIAGVALKAALFFVDTDNVLTKLSPWANVDKASVPFDGEDPPEIEFRFEAPVEVDYSTYDGKLYLIVAISETTPTGRVSIPFNDVTGGNSLYVTSETTFESTDLDVDWTQLSDTRNDFAISSKDVYGSFNENIVDTSGRSTTIGGVSWDKKYLGLSSSSSATVVVTIAGVGYSVTVSAGTPYYINENAYVAMVKSDATLTTYQIYLYTREGTSGVHVPDTPLAVRWTDDSIIGNGTDVVCFGDGYLFVPNDSTTYTKYAYAGSVLSDSGASPECIIPNGSGFVAAYMEDTGSGYRLAVNVIDGVTAVPSSYASGTTSYTYNKTAVSLPTGNELDGTSSLVHGVAGTPGDSSYFFLIAPKLGASGGSASAHIRRVYDDGGMTMNTVTNTGGVLTEASCLACDVNDNKLYIASLHSGYSGISKSTDNGDSFSVVKAGTYYCVACDTTATNARVYAGGDGVVAYSSDAGSSWTNVVISGKKIIALAVSPADETYIYALAQSGEVYRSINSGAAFTKVGDVAAITTLYSNTYYADIAKRRLLVASPSNKDVFYIAGTSTDASVERITPSLDGVGKRSITRGAVQAVATGKAATCMYFFKDVSFSITGGDSNVYYTVSDATLTVDTANADTFEPESTDDGGTETFDKYVILLRDRALGGEFREVGVIAPGDSYTFNESSESLAVKTAYIPGLREVPGGFAVVSNVRQGGTERLAFSGQDGFDFAVGYPGLDDESYSLTSPSVRRTENRMYVLPPYVGKVSSIDDQTTYQVWTLTDVDADNFALVSAGDEIPFITRSNTGGFAIVQSTSSAGGTYTITITRIAYEQDATDASIYAPYGDPLEIGTRTQVNSSYAYQRGDGTYIIAIDSPTQQEKAYIAQLRAGDYVRIEDVYAIVVSTDPNAGRLYVSVAGDGSSIPTDAADVVYLPHGTIYNAIDFQVATFWDTSDREIARGWTRKSTTNGLVEIYTSYDFGTYGVRGGDPNGAARVEFRLTIKGSVRKGSTRVTLPVPVADDFWHQRYIAFDGDEKKGRIKKVVKYNTATGEALVSPQLELEKPWDGDDHSYVPITVLGDYSSLWFTGWEPSWKETVSPFTKLDLLPGTGIEAHVSTHSRLAVFAKQDEVFMIQVANFTMPTSAEEAIAFSIENNVGVESLKTVFALSTKDTAIDGAGIIYMGGRDGIYRFNPPIVEPLPGMRDRFAKFHKRDFTRMALAFDSGIFPSPMLRIGGLGFAEGERKEVLAWSPGFERWFGLGADVVVEAMADAITNDGSGVVAFGGKGRLGYFGGTITEEDNTAWSGEDYGKNLYAEGQPITGSWSGFIGSADIASEQASPRVYAIDVTYQDSTASSPEYLDLAAFGTLLNAPFDGSDVPIYEARSPIMFAKWNMSTGAVETGEIVGLDRPVGERVNTLYVKVDSDWTDTSGTKYHWMIGPRKWSIKTPAIAPQGKSLQVTRLDLDVTPVGSSSAPWWMTVNLYGAWRGNVVDWTTPIASRVVPYSRFADSSTTSLHFRTKLCRAIAIGVEGYAPAAANHRLAEIKASVFDGQV